MLYVKRVRCQGCKALKLVSSRIGDDQVESFVCQLGVPIETTNQGFLALRPRPLEKCYRPLTAKELAVATTQMRKRIKK